MIENKNNLLAARVMLFLMIMILSSCKELSELSPKPFVMATAATYTEINGGPLLLRFTIVYWADDISDLKITITDPDGAVASDWQQGAGTLSSGTPVKIDGIPKKTGGWSLSFSGTVKTNNDNYGAKFEDDAIVNVED